MCIRDRLVSVRSGARASMPGMMDTILNLGLNDATVKGLAAVSYTHLRAHETVLDLVCRLLLEKKKNHKTQ